MLTLIKNVKCCLGVHTPCNLSYEEAYVLACMTLIDKLSLSYNFTDFHVSVFPPLDLVYSLCIYSSELKDVLYLPSDS